MIQYILEVITFQLVFLIIYDFWLKRETFFQWNRAYLIGTYVLSMVLPWIKLEALKTTVPQSYYAYPEFLWTANDMAGVGLSETASARLSISWEYALLFGGMFLASLFFAHKLRQLYLLKKKGKIERFTDFTQIIVANSQIAFSFFKSIFMGDKVLEGDYKSVIAHELVHIKQRHTYDLLFFELMRIVCWFNPLVYVYQSRVSELHEFIADAQVAKANKAAHYQLLLSQVFETQHISFINQFFKSSLIKKRIVMLQKSQSKKIWQLKYLLLVPMVLGMLMYTSSAQEIQNSTSEPSVEQQIGDEALIRQINNWIDQEEDLDIILVGNELREKEQDRNYVFTKKEYFKMNLLTRRALKITFMNGTVIRSEKSQSLNQMPLPSTAAYQGYVSRKKAFQILDKNLKMSINREELSIRKIVKEDKNLGPGEFVKVADVSDLTGEEIRNFNRTLAHLDFNSRFLFLSDDEHAFLISKAEKQVYDTPKSNSSLKEFKELEESNTAATKYNVILKQRNRLLKNSTQNSAIIKNLDEELLKLKKSAQNGGQTANRGAQNNQIHVPFGTVDEVPIFPGCEDAENQKDCFLERMQEHIRKNFKYPIGAQEQGIQGRVSIMFTIDEEGAIEKIRKRGPDKLLEQEAVRIISLLPNMTPGKHKGEVVKVPFSIPITFKLNNSKVFELQEIKSNLDGEALRLTKKYNELVQERNSLDTKDLKIKDLEEKLFILKVQLKEIMNKMDQEITGVPFTEVDEVPIFPGCENSNDKRECFKKAIQKHVNDNFSYPKEAQKKAIQGRVSVLFYIEQDGVVRKILKRGPDVLLENEAERIMKLLPQMLPGKHEGKAVRVPFSIPITFKLN